MKGLGVAILAIAACLIVIVPASSAAVMTDHNGHDTYTANGITITVQSKNTLISADGQTYGISWEIYMINGTSQVLEQFGSYQVNRINNSAQNSVIVIVENNDVKAAEVYSFEGQSVDASIALQSFVNGSATFIVDFVTTMNPHQHVRTYGFSDQNFNFKLSTNKVIAPISSNSWGLEDQYVSISWENEMSIFHSGVIESALPQNIVSLPFGPFVLQTNETYDIDPVIKPMIIPPPPGGGGGGGGSGGGGSGGTPPQLSSFYMDTNYASVTYVGDQIKMTANVYSLGSGGDTIKYYVVTAPYSQWELIHQSGVSSTGPNDFTWTATGGSYLYFVVDLENGYGGMSMSTGGAFVTLTAFPTGYGTSYVNQPDVEANVPVQDSSGITVGYLSIGMGGVSEFGVTGTIIPTITESFMAVNSSAGNWDDWKSVGGVNSFSQSLTWKGNSKGDTSSSAPSWLGIIDPVASYQAPKSDPTLTTAEEMVWSGLAAILAATGLGDAVALSIVMAFLYPLAFSNNPNSVQITQSTYGIDSVQDSYNAGSTIVCWNTIINSNFNKTFIFDLAFTMKWYDETGGGVGAQYTSQNPLVNYFTNSATMGVTPDAYTTAPIIVPLSEPIYIGEYN